LKPYFIVLHLYDLKFWGSWTSVAYKKSYIKEFHWSVIQIVLYWIWKGDGDVLDLDTKRQGQVRHRRWQPHLL